MTVKELIEDLNKYYKSDDKVRLQIKIDTGEYVESYLNEVYRDPEDEDCPVLSNEDEDGNYK